MPSSRADRRGPGQQPLERRGRVLLAALEVDHACRRARSGSRARCSPRSAAPAGRLERHALVDVARGLRDAGDDQRRPARSDSLAAASGRRRCAPRRCRTRGAGGPTTRPACTRRSSPCRTRKLDVVARRPPSRRTASGTPQRGKLLVKICVRAECRPRVAAVEERRVGGDRRAAAAAPAAAGRRRATARSAPRTPTCTCSAEGVVAPRDVLQAVLDAAVVLGVDDRAARGSRPTDGCRSRRARRPCASASANSRVAALALAARARRRRSSPRPERISISEEISSPAIDSASTGSSRGGVAQLLEARARARASPGRGSRTPPRCPTVKSVEASKTLAAGEVEVRWLRRAAQVR